MTDTQTQNTPQSQAAPTTAADLGPNMALGHVHLRVSDVDRAVAFYTDVLGFEVQQTFGHQAAFLSTGGYHHHLGLNSWDSAGGPPAPKNAAGLYHVAFVYPDREALGTAINRAEAQGVVLEGAADHGVSEAVYFSDPDGNGIELYRDRPRDAWPRDPQGNLSMVNARLDVDALRALGLPAKAPANGVSATG